MAQTKSNSSTSITKRISSKTSFFRFRRIKQRSDFKLVTGLKDNVSLVIVSTQALKCFQSKSEVVAVVVKKKKFYIGISG